MSQHYSNPERANEPNALPDVEVFFSTPANGHLRKGFEYNAECGFVVCQNCYKPLYPMEVEGGVSNCCGAVALAPGWYWQPCFPGCLPDGEPNGPFPTKQEAIDDAQSNR